MTRTRGRGNDYDSSLWCPHPTCRFRMHITTPRTAMDKHAINSVNQYRIDTQVFVSSTQLQGPVYLGFR